MSYEILRLLRRPEYPEYASLIKETHPSYLIHIINNYLNRKYASRTNNLKLGDAFYMKLRHE